MSDEHHPDFAPNNDITPSDAEKMAWYEERMKYLEARVATLIVTADAMQDTIVERDARIYKLREALREARDGIHDLYKGGKPEEAKKGVHWLHIQQYVFKMTATLGEEDV